MIKGYEFAKDQYVILSAEELKALEEKATSIIDIVEFVPLDQETEMSRAYRDFLNSEGSPSEAVPAGYVWNPGTELAPPGGASR